MYTMEIAIVVAIAVSALVIYGIHRRAMRKAQERHDELLRQIEENNQRIRQMRLERRAAMTASPAYTSNRVTETKTHQRRYSDDRTVIYNDDTGADILTQMILQQAMSSPNDTVSGTVSWSNDTPTITPTSSYSSSSDDSCSRSSYDSSSSSSYSSDSSSSYSSSDSGSFSSSCD